LHLAQREISFEPIALRRQMLPRAATCRAARIHAALLLRINPNC